MKKILFILFICLMMVTNVFANGVQIVDNADLFTSEEETIINNEIENLKNKHEIDFVIYTEDEYVDSVKMRAADLYDYSSYESEGVMLYINMSNREYFLLTTGDETIMKLTDQTLDNINYGVEESLRYGDYKDAAMKYLEGVDYALVNYNEINTPSYNPSYNNNPNTNYPSYHSDDVNDSYNLKEALMYGFTGAILITFIVIFVLIKQLKSIANQRNASAYSVSGGNYCKADIKHSRDMFLYRNVTRVKIERNNSNNGGSSTFRGSSGVSHGGRGGSF